MNNSAPTASISHNVKYGYKLGFSFTPLAGKRPTLRGWQSRPRETLAQALSWAQKGNVGLRTGMISKVVVIDADAGADIAGLKLPATVAVNTGGEGLHLYYRCNKPIGNSAGKLGPHIDVKGDRGQVVYPGSVHPETQQKYDWAEGHEPWNIELAELPEHIIEKLNGQKLNGNSTSTPNDQISSYLSTALKREIAAVEAAGQGTRNNVLNTAAFNLGTLIGGGYLEQTAVEEALTQAAVFAGLSNAEATATIRSGIESGIKKPRKISTPQTNRNRRDYILVPGPHKDDHDRYFEQSNVDFANVVLDEFPQDGIYRKDHIPGEIIGEVGKRRWLELSVDRMRLMTDTHTRLGKWVTDRKGRSQVMIYKPCDRNNAGIVIAQAMQRPSIRELTLMVSYPTYGPGFTKVPPGWHDGLFYDEPAELRDIKPEPDCEVIHNILHDLVVDFPFKTEADKQNFFGLLLTPIIAPALEGNRPMHLINSPLERTGKSKLVNEVFGGLITGKDTPSMQITEREEEREKRILAMLLHGETLMHLDNLPRYIDSAALSSLLTTQWFIGRMLGFSRNVCLPNNLTIVGTGNNIQASGEITKRIVPIMIEPTTADPESRKDFQHPDIRAYVHKRRRLVLQCLLGLVENWLAAGRPKCPNRLGGFENWSEAIGGILQVNAMTYWRKNESDWRQRANVKGMEMLRFVELWHQKFGAKDASPRELTVLAAKNDLFQNIMARSNRRAIATAFGRMLQQNTDAPVGRWYIRYDNISHRPVYHLEEIA